jgi:hypothetical protein
VSPEDDSGVAGKTDLRAGSIAVRYGTSGYETMLNRFRRYVTRWLVPGGPFILRFPASGLAAQRCLLAAAMQFRA